MTGLTIWGALSFWLMMTAAVVLLHRRVGREPDTFVKRALVLGFVGKLGASGAYYYVISHIYADGDSFRYLAEGTRIAGQLRDGSMPESAWDTGTASMEFLAGVLFAVTQPSMLIGFSAFALLAYLGAVLALDGFTMAFPEGDRRRYAAVVLLLPSMLFWPSSLSKDSWLVFALGVAILGTARMLRRRPGGYLLVALGAAGVYLIRPHMGALLLVTAAAGFAVRFRDPDVRRGATAWLAGLVIVGTGTGFVLANFTDELLPVDHVAEGSRVEALLDRTQAQTAIGGSQFVPQPVESIGDLPHAFATVPFRPFPWEAEGGTAVLASIEGIALLALVLLSLPRLRRLPKALLRRPFVAFATAYSLGFIVAFSTIGNFGILARQRTQFLPLFAVLLALPAVTRSARNPQGAVGPAVDGKPRQMPLRA